MSLEGRKKEWKESLIIKGEGQLLEVVIGFKTLIINLHLGSIDIFKVVDKVPGQVPHL